MEARSLSTTTAKKRRLIGWAQSANRWWPRPRITEDRLEGKCTFQTAGNTSSKVDLLQRRRCQELHRIRDGRGRPRHRHNPYHADHNHVDAHDADYRPRPPANPATAPARLWKEDQARSSSPAVSAGSTVHGSIKVLPGRLRRTAGSRATVSSWAPRWPRRGTPRRCASRLSGALVPESGHVSFSVPLTAKGKAALRRQPHLALTVKITLTPVHGASVDDHPPSIIVPA